MENVTFNTLSTLKGQPCIYQHGDSTFADCTITGIDGSDTIRINQGVTRIQSITPRDFFVLIMSQHAIKIVFVA